MKSRLLQNLALGLILAAGAAVAKTSAPPLTGDAAIADRAAHEVRSYPYYSIFDNINIRVTDGRLELMGEVNQPFKKADLGKAMSRIPGVAVIDNELKVAPLSNFDDRLRFQVARAIYRDPMLSQYSMAPVGPIHILVDNGHVTLEGVVRTETEKNVAGIRANAGMSFGMPVNNLRVEQPAPSKK